MSLGFLIIAQKIKPKPAKKKKSKKDSELEALKAELDAKNDLLLRTAAEFDNYKKRTDRERASIAEFAKAGISVPIIGFGSSIAKGAIKTNTFINTYRIA